MESMAEVSGGDLDCVIKEYKDLENSHELC